ncbi:hypothetical protein BC6_00009 [Bacillus phage BC-6]|nr:hypothetical protein BC6_00009 [Bacillus phage BC-6]
MKPETVKKDTYQLNSIISIESHYNDEKLIGFTLKERDGGVIILSKQVSLALVQAIKNAWEVK